MRLRRVISNGGHSPPIPVAGRVPVTGSLPVTRNRPMVPRMTEQQKKALRAARSRQQKRTAAEAYAQMDRQMGRTPQTMEVPECRPDHSNQTGNSR